MLGHVPISGAPLASSAAIEFTDVTGYLEASEVTDALVFNVVSSLSFSIAIADVGDIASVDIQAVTGALVTATEAADISAITTTSVTPSSFAISDAADTASLTADIVAALNVAATEAPDIVNIPDAIIVYSSFPTPIGASAIGACVIPPDLLSAFSYLSVSEQADTIEAFAQFGVAALDVIEASDGANIVASITSDVSVSASENADTAVFQTSAVTIITAGISEPQDIAAIQTAFLSTAELGAIEQPDITNITVAVGIAVVAATDPSDGSFISVNVVGTLQLLASEEADKSSIHVYGQWGEMIVPAATNWQLVA